MSDKIVSGKKLFLVVNVDWFFLSHRLPVALEAKKRGYDVTVLAIEEEGRGDEIRSHGLRFVPLPSSRGGKNVLDEIRLIRFLIKIYRVEKPDIVHHVAIKPVLYGSLAAKFVPVPKIVNAVSGFGTVFIQPNPWSPIFQFVNNLYKFSFKNPRLHVIVQNEDDVAQLESFNSLAPHQIHLIKGSGVDLKDFSFSEEEKSEVVRVLLPSRMLWDKGVGEFVEAAKILKKKHGATVEFILAGKVDPENSSNISEEKLKKWTADGHVQWIGYQRDMVKICREANIVCLPSYREGLPKALIEAEAIGRPIVTTDVPGCRVVVEDGVNGFLVPAREVLPLAEALEKLILDKNLRLKMGRESRKLAEKEFSIEMVLARTFEIYEK